MNYFRLIYKKPILKLITEIYKKKKYENIHKDKNLTIGLSSVLTRTTIENNVWIDKSTSLTDCFVGKNTEIGQNCKIKKTRIGRFCSIGNNIQICLGWHPTNLVSTHPSFYSSNKHFKTYARENLFKSEWKNTVIGHDVWIGNNVVIPGGITIGNGAVLASNAVVTKDVPPYAIVGGVPGKIIRYRHSTENIKALQSIKWWDFEENWFNENYKLMQDVEAFIKKMLERSESD